MNCPAVGYGMQSLGSVTMFAYRRQFSSRASMEWAIHELPLRVTGLSSKAVRMISFIRTALLLNLITT